MVVISWTAGVYHYGAKEVKGWLRPLTAGETTKLATIWLLGHVIGGFCQFILGLCMNQQKLYVLQI